MAQPIPEEGFMTRVRRILRTSPYSRYALISSIIQTLVQVVLESVIAITHRTEITRLADIKTNKMDDLFALLSAVSVYHVIYMVRSVLFCLSLNPLPSYTVASGS
jgi:hypothetical protein